MISCRRGFLCCRDWVGGEWKGLVAIRSFPEKVVDLEISLPE